jgi:cell division protease FtsH
MMRQRRDEEVSEIAEEAYRGATALITEHRDLLDEIANKLLDDEVIERTEIVSIMAGRRPGDVVPEAVVRTTDDGQ